MIKDNMVMSGLDEKDEYTFPSPMMLRFQAIQSACSFQRKYWIGVLVVLMLMISGIISAIVIVASKDYFPENTSSTSSIAPTPSSTSTPEPEPYSKTRRERLSLSGYGLVSSFQNNLMTFIFYFFSKAVGRGWQVWT